MKFQRIAGRLAAGMMTGAVLLTTFGGNALAATGDDATGKDGIYKRW